MLSHSKLFLYSISPVILEYIVSSQFGIHFSLQFIMSCIVLFIINYSKNKIMAKTWIYIEFLFSLILFFLSDWELCFMIILTPIYSSLAPFLACDELYLFSISMAHYNALQIPFDFWSLGRIALLNSYFWNPEKTKSTNIQYGILILIFSILGAVPSYSIICYFTLLILNNNYPNLSNILILLNYVTELYFRSHIPYNFSHK